MFLGAGGTIAARRGHVRGGFVWGRAEKKRGRVFGRRACPGGSGRDLAARRGTSRASSARLPSGERSDDPPGDTSDLRRPVVKVMGWPTRPDRTTGAASAARCGKSLATSSVTTRSARRPERALVAARRRVEASTALTAASGTARGAPPGGSAGGERAAIHTGSDRRAG